MELLNDYGKQVFESVKADLEALELWQDTYVQELEAYSFACQMCVKLREEIDREGVTVNVTNKSGAKVEIANPDVYTYQMFFNQSLKLADKFGQTPASRKRLGIKSAIRKVEGPARFKISR